MQSNKIDIQDLTVEELQNLQQEAKQLIETKKEENITQAYEQILNIAELVGFTVPDLLAWGQQRTKVKTRKPVLPRYMSKTNVNDTWTGRGKRPHWLVAEINKGAKLEDFLIP
ncbi:H-NS histone family protein [Acinetobacter ursingii]|uniref:H-NS histone family protein n=1 Tax=Acinetobacter ursingii TaxID=108980 RepID=UPI003009BD73